MPSALFICAKQNNTLKYFFTHRRCITFTTLKADQINILRKQYDAFLEEDKKRKERNECILEKLDQMRLSNTVTRYKSNIYSYSQTNNATKQPSSANSIRKYTNEDLLPTEIDVLPKPLDEKYLINEISKKYILIPKLRSFVSEDYVPRAIKQDNNNDNDWKSKYSILDKLKQNEKGEMNYSALNGRNENYLDHIPSKEPKFGIEEKACENDMHSKQYASKPENNMACLKNEGKTKVNFTTVDAKEEGIIETEKRSDTSPKLSSNISGSLKPDAELNNRDQNIHNNSKVVTEGQHGLQPDQGTTTSELSTPKYTYPIRNDHEHESAVFENTDDQLNEPLYDDKHENEASEKDSLEVINHVKVVNTMKAVVQETDNENHNMGAPETQEYPTANAYVQDLALADGVNIHPEGYAERQAYLAPSDQYVSEPAAEFEQVYQPEEQPAGDDQYFAEQTASAEQVHLPGVNQPQHYVPDPTSAEQAYMPGTDHSQGGHQQYVSEPTVPEESYVSGDNTQINEDQHVSEPVAADTEQKDYTIENDGFQITSQENQDLPLDTVTSEIAEFEAEQSQMFYSEQPNYEDYNQAAEGGVYNSDNTGYDPALYYQQEAAYPVEINEHEETSTRYDPSYEQQYAGQGAELEYAEQQQYGDQQYAEQQQYNEQQYAEQQYGEQQQSELGETMYVYDQVPSETVPEKPIVEQVQQELDNEDFNVRNKTAAGDVVEESALYMQNPGDVAPNETYTEQQETPEKVS